MFPVTVSDGGEWLVEQEFADADVEGLGDDRADRIRLLEDVKVSSARLRVLDVSGGRPKTVTVPDRVRGCIGIIFFVLVVISIDR
jgi:hypothetical protein